MTSGATETATPPAWQRSYAEHYGQLGLDIGNPTIWALDSFRSIDPVYIQNYVLGAVVAEQTQHHLQSAHGKDFRRWGQVLRDLYADGRNRPLPVKLAALGVTTMPAGDLRS